MLVGRAAVRPDVCPSPPLGPQSDWCLPYLPLSQGQNSLWSGVAPVWASCTLPGLWCCFDGIWRISWGGSTRYTVAGGVGSARFAFSGPLQEGPCSTRSEANPSEGWIHRSTALGVCMVQASSVMGTGSLWDFGWGWEKEMALASAFVPHRAELCLLGLNNSPSWCPLTLPLSGQSCWLLTFQMLSPVGCQNSRSPAPPLLLVRLGGSALLGRLPLQCPGSPLQSM